MSERQLRFPMRLCYCKIRVKMCDAGIAFLCPFVGIIFVQSLGILKTVGVGKFYMYKLIVTDAK